MPILHLVPPVSQTSSDTSPASRPKPPASLYTCQSINLSNSPGVRLLQSRLGLSKPEAYAVRPLLDEMCAHEPSAQGGCLGECSGRVLADVVGLHRVDGDQFLAACLDAELVHHDHQGRLHNTDFCSRYRIQKAKAQAARDATCRKSERQKQRRAEARQAQEDRMEAAQPPAMLAAGGGFTHASLASPRLHHGVSQASRTASMAQNTVSDAIQRTSELTPLSSLFSPISSVFGQRSGADDLGQPTAEGGDSPPKGCPPPPPAPITCELGSRRDKDPSAGIVRAREATPPPMDDGYLDSLMAEAAQMPPPKATQARPVRRALAPWQRPLDRQKPGEGTSFKLTSPPIAPATPRPAPSPTPTPAPARPTPPAPEPERAPSQSVGQGHPADHRLPIDVATLDAHTRNRIISTLFFKRLMSRSDEARAATPTAKDACHLWEQMGEDGQLDHTRNSLENLLGKRRQAMGGAKQPEVTMAHVVAYRPLVDGYVRAITDAHFVNDGPSDDEE